MMTRSMSTQEYESKCSFAYNKLIHLRKAQEKNNNPESELLYRKWIKDLEIWIEAIEDQRKKERLLLTNI